MSMRPVPGMYPVSPLRRRVVFPPEFRRPMIRFIEGVVPSEHLWPPAHSNNDSVLDSTGPVADFLNVTSTAAGSYRSWRTVLSVLARSRVTQVLRAHAPVIPASVVDLGRRCAVDVLVDEAVGANHLGVALGEKAVPVFVDRSGPVPTIPGLGNLGPEPFHFGDAECSSPLIRQYWGKRFPAFPLRVMRSAKPVADGGSTAFRELANRPSGILLEPNRGQGFPGLKLCVVRLAQSFRRCGAFTLGAITSGDLSSSDGFELTPTAELPVVGAAVSTDFCRPCATNEYTIFTNHTFHYTRKECLV